MRAICATARRDARREDARFDVVAGNDIKQREMQARHECGGSVRRERTSARACAA